MKKLIAFLLVCTIAVTAFGQEHVVEKKDKMHRTSTLGQKAHNMFSKHKHYSGYKVKHKKKVAKM
jgi:hypothetical protein